VSADPAHACIPLRHGRWRATVLPQLGGSLGRLDHQRDSHWQPLLRPAPANAHDPRQTACFPMAPFCGRIRDGRFVFRGRAVSLPATPPETHSPLHGLVWHQPWQVVERDAARLAIACAHPPGDWPWPFLAVQVFSLDDDGLGIELSVTNSGREVMPCGLGLHPYFPCNIDTRISARLARRVRRDAAQIPVGHESCTGFAHTAVHGLDSDDSFDGWDGQLRIDDADGIGTLLACADATRLHVYAPAGADYFCAEPISHEVNALALDDNAARAAGLQLLAPAASARLRLRVQLP